ncbi:GspE/PulE family protein [Patescibacteria group bacterium]|nr:GspE/PulE family protein [Patescibacteria group bacterium]MBU1951540.1 GspE/PulE family protein [Patescibacteria group bacterium]
MANTIDDLINGSDKKKVHISSDETEEKLDQKIRDIDIKEKERVVEEKAALTGFSYISLKGFPIQSEAISVIPEDKSKEAKTICFYRADNEIRFGIVDVNNQKSRDIRADLKTKYPDLRQVEYMISNHSFEHAHKLYASVPKIKKVTVDLEITEEDLNRYEEELSSFRELDEKLKKVSLSDMITIMLAGAIQSRSSDIHIEAEKNDIKIRYRIDGMLQVVAKLDNELWPKLISRIKSMSGMKLNITDIPQDGRISIQLSDDIIDVRVSTLPSAYGESVVMRLLVSSLVGLGFNQLGIRGKAYEDLKKEVERPNGMIMTTGPTSSGKTTTLYAILNKLNSPETKIITLENPIEYKLDGVVQSQIKSAEKSEGEDLKDALKEGLTGGGGGGRSYTFAQGLRSILRQDPDVIMVGEIRDLETAEISIQSALTGHLVISTIHTNDATGAIPRFLSMGVKPFLLAPALNAIVGQRLVRKICQECKEEIKLDEPTLNRVKEILSEIPENSGERVDPNSLKFYRGRGCEKCNNIGLKGRLGIFEIFTMNQEIEEIILSGKVSEYQMKEVATKYGMVTMVQDGLLKAKDGITSVDEVFRVVE